MSSREEGEAPSTLEQNKEYRQIETEVFRGPGECQKTKLRESIEGEGLEDFSATMFVFASLSRRTSNESGITYFVLSPLFISIFASAHICLGG